MFNLRQLTTVSLSLSALGSNSLLEQFFFIALNFFTNFLPRTLRDSSLTLTSAKRSIPPRWTDGGSTGGRVPKATSAVHGGTGRTKSRVWQGQSSWRCLRWPEQQAAPILTSYTFHKYDSITVISWFYNRPLVDLSPEYLRLMKWLLSNICTVFFIFTFFLVWMKQFVFVFWTWT